MAFADLTEWLFLHKSAMDNFSLVFTVTIHDCRASAKDSVPMTYPAVQSQSGRTLMVESGRLSIGEET